MEQRKISIITTKDGSNSIYLPDYNESYHSVHGAITESVHIYINTGLHSIEQEEVSILEIGFGTGLNALLTAIESFKTKRSIHYVTLEPYPLEQKYIEQLNYIDALQAMQHQKLLQDLHHASWDSDQSLHPHFQFRKEKIKAKDFQSLERFDLIYYDAFAPRVQPELWTKEIFMKMHDLLKPEGRLVTYCAKGEVKRTLVAVGFVVESLPGPPGKREIVRAIRLPNL